MYLSDLAEFGSVGRAFGKNGKTDDGRNISVNGVKFLKGLFTHPTANGYSSVKYRLDGLNAVTFEAKVAINDGGDGIVTPLTFHVLGDGNVLWSSQPIRALRRTQDCRVGLENIHVLELRVNCPGADTSAHAVWLEPYVLYLTPERRHANLLKDGSFEEATKKNWVPRSWRGNQKAVTIVGDSPKHGKRSVAIQTAEPDDVSYIQKVGVKASTRYLLSGWIKTRDIKVTQTGGQGGEIGANLSLYGSNEVSSSLVGTKVWTYMTLIFDSGKRTEVEVCARLGFFNSAAIGAAWFDDLSLIELPEVTKVPPSSEDKKPKLAPAAIEITSALVKKKFKGKASYDSETATLTLVYDFKSPAQLKDFDMEKAKGGLGGGFLHLQTDGRAKHIVKFKEVTVVGVVIVKTMKGRLFITTGGASVGFGGANPDTIYLDSGKGHAELIVPEKERTGYIPMALNILPSRLAFAYGKSNLGFATKDAQAGFIEFVGGDVGYSYGQLSVTGRPLVRKRLWDF